MYVELVLASLATFIWWYTEPGLLNHLCLNVMFVSSVSTLVFNANPLLRYDGYYILADLTEIPNLRQKATSILSRKMGEWFLGLEQPDDPFLPERNQLFFALYSVAAAIYRWVVVFSILWFLYKVWEPYNLQIIGQIIACMSLWGLLVMPLYQVAKFFYVPGRLEKVKKPRMYASIGGTLAVLIGVAMLPLPHSIMADLEIQARDADPVYVAVAEGGRLTAVEVKAGDVVKEGQLLARLENHDLDLQIAELQGEENSYRTQRDSLLRQGLNDHRAMAEIPQIVESLETVRQQREEKERDQPHLRAVPRRQRLPPPPAPPDHEDPEEALPNWTKTPLDEENRHAYLKEGVLFCQIGDPRELEAVLMIDQGDFEFVEEGRHQKVDIKLDALPFDTISGEIAETARADMRVTPQRLSRKNGGELATTTDPTTGIERPQETTYQARVPLYDKSGLLRLGLRGRAKIHAAWMPLYQRLWRIITHTFNFKL